MEPLYSGAVMVWGCIMKLTLGFILVQFTNEQ